ncbi:hypothetical protein ABBQ32_011593 [Trebouxia sp. C0010 RCD-2024]
MMGQLERGWLTASCQELLAFSEEACFIIIQTFTPTDDILALGPVTFQELLGNLHHVSFSVLGEDQAQHGRVFVLVSDRHPDPSVTEYPFDHYMPCLPAVGCTSHTFDTPASEWAAYLRQLRLPAPVDDGVAVDTASVSAASTAIAAKEELVKPSSVHANKLIHDVYSETGQQQQQTRSESSSMAQMGTTPKQQPMPSLPAMSPLQGIGPAAAAVHSPQPPAATVQKEGSSRLHSSPVSHRPAVTAKGATKGKPSSSPSGTSKESTSEQGIPTGFWKKVKAACRAAGLRVASGLKKGAVWLRNCPGRAVSLIKNVATAALGISRQ